MSDSEGCSSQVVATTPSRDDSRCSTKKVDQVHDSVIMDGDDDEKPVKRVKLIKNEQLYIRDLPSCEAYERSYMHRDLITHVIVTKTQFLVTASQDGVIKFWKKISKGIEFVKSFKTHTGPIEDITVTSSGNELASISKKDKTVKVFDVVNFDMINMFTLDFEPRCVEWIDSASMVGENLVISDSQTCKIYTFDGRQSSSEPRRCLDHIHGATVCRMRMNPVMKTMVSADIEGNVKLWLPKSGKPPKIQLYEGPEANVFNEFKSETKGLQPRLHNLSFSPDGKCFATTASDRRIRVFRMDGFRLRSYDESLTKLEHDQKAEPLMNNMDFARRMAIERELDKTGITRQEVVVFDQSGYFILYPTMLGVKILNWRTNRLVRSLGRHETNFRPLALGLFQGLIFEKLVRRFNADALESGTNDPTVFCSSFKKNRFYCFSHRYFEEVQAETDASSAGGPDGAGQGGGVIKERDIYNEKPTREEIMAAIEIEQQEKLERREMFENATIHTTMGDIHLKLFPHLAPKACENFCVHSKNGYYNNHIFHRVIKQFMIQTGDPTGTGTGGESIWDEDFDDEFCDELKHDKPFTLSMANCGPNTNGSQFFITVAPCDFLDNKHTIFGRVVRGMDVCLNISKVKTDSRTDKPHDDVKIVNIKVF